MIAPAHPYAAVLGERKPVEVMAATPGRRLRRLLDSRTAEQIEQPPAPGKWNFREVLAHLADCEIAWSWRLRFAYEKDHAVMQPFEQDPWARIYGVYSAEQALATFTALRGWNLAFLGGLSEADKQRPVTHPELAGMTLWTIAEIAAGHDLHHLAALEKLSSVSTENFFRKRTERGDVQSSVSNPSQSRRRTTTA